MTPARPSSIDDSPPGSWRAALARRAGMAAVCAVCRQSTCHHTDAEYRDAAIEPGARP